MAFFIVTRAMPIAHEAVIFSNKRDFISQLIYR